jgi:hypothetical protein
LKISTKSNSALGLGFEGRFIDELYRNELCFNCVFKKKSINNNTSGVRGAARLGRKANY